MATATTIPGLTVGGRTITDLDNLVVLRASTGSSAVNYSPFHKDGATAAYSVPGGFNLRIVAASTKGTSASNYYHGTFGHADGACVAEDTATPPGATRTFVGGRDIPTHGNLNAAATDTTRDESAEDFLIPTGQFPFWKNTLGVGAVAIYGILEAI